jgi:transposase
LTVHFLKEKNMPMPSIPPLDPDDPKVKTPASSSSPRPDSGPAGAPTTVESTSPSGKTVGSHEVRPRTPRRTFKLAEKRRIVAEADRCTKRGQVGELLRREGIYSSHLSDWRRALAVGGPEPRRGRPTKLDPKDRAIAHLERQVARLEREAERAKALLALQKKAFQLLEAAEAIGAS